MVNVNLFGFVTRMKFLEKQKRGEMSVKECCDILKISRSTWYNRVAEVSRCGL